MREIRKRIQFERLPKDYAGLCTMVMPRPIHDQVEMGNVIEIAEAMAGHTLTVDQADYFDLLCRLIEDYEQDHVSTSKVSGMEALTH